MRPGKTKILYIIIWQGKSERSDWFFLGQDSAIRTVSMETVFGCVFFLFSKAGKFKTSMARVPYNKLLTNPASSSRTGEYWPPVVLVRTSGQYSPVRPSLSVSKRLLFWIFSYGLRWSSMFSSSSNFTQNRYIILPSYSFLLHCLSPDYEFS